MCYPIIHAPLARKRLVGTLSGRHFCKSSRLKAKERLTGSGSSCFPTNLFLGSGGVTASLALALLPLCMLVDFLLLRTATTSDSSVLSSLERELLAPPDKASCLVHWMSRAEWIQDKSFGMGARLQDQRECSSSMPITRQFIELPAWLHIWWLDRSARGWWNEQNLTLMGKHVY